MIGLPTKLVLKIGPYLDQEINMNVLVFNKAGKYIHIYIWIIYEIKCSLFFSVTRQASIFTFAFFSWRMDEGPEIFQEWWTGEFLQWGASPWNLEGELLQFSGFSIWKSGEYSIPPPMLRQPIRLSTCFCLGSLSLPLLSWASGCN